MAVELVGVAFVLASCSSDSGDSAAVEGIEAIIAGHINIDINPSDIGYPRRRYDDPRHLLSRLRNRRLLRIRRRRQRHAKAAPTRTTGPC